MRVLVVEGHLRVRERLAALIAEIPGVRAVLEATDAAQALAHAIGQCPEVIVLDLRVDDGLTVAGLLRRGCPTTMLIGLTSEPSDGLVRACARLGVDRVYDKSRDLLALQAAIEAAADGPNR